MTKRKLADLLAEMRKQSYGNVPEVAAAYDRLVGRLEASEMSAGALREGDTIPPFGLLSTRGHFVTSEALLEGGPLVISFNRGAWCPYCRAEIAALVGANDAIRAKGARLVAISAETGGRGATIFAGKDLPFDVLCDADLGVALMFGLVFRISDEVRGHYIERGINLPLSQGNPTWFLPVPATYVIGRDGRIAAAFVDPEFRRRMDPTDILAALDALNAPPT